MLKIKIMNHTIYSYNDDIKSDDDSFDNDSLDDEY